MREADARQEAAHAPDSPARKDVWHPDLDVATAVRARVDADAEPRIAARAAELAELQAANDAARARVEALEREAAGVQDETAAALALVDTLVARIPADPAVSAARDALLAELGPV